MIGGMMMIVTFLFIIIIIIIIVVGSSSCSGINVRVIIMSMMATLTYRLSRRRKSALLGMDKQMTGDHGGRVGFLR